MWGCRAASGEPFTCQAARPLEGGRGIQLLRVLAVRLGRVDQALGGRQGGVRADGGAQLVDGRGGDGGLHGGGRGHADRGQAGRGHDDVDGRAGAVGLGQAAGRLLGHLDYFGPKFEDLKGNLAEHLVIQQKNEANTPRYN